MRHLRTIILALGLTLTSCNAPTSKQDARAVNANPWQLVNADSRLNFISVKKGTVAEIHHFKALSGTVDLDGNARILIALDSVETNIDIRNNRMRAHIFETDKTPNAILSTQIDMINLADMTIGERKELSQIIVVHMRGKTESIDVDMIVTRLGQNRITVDNRTPVIVHIDTFGMASGVEKLRELANLTSITPEVPVTFSLVFER